MFTSFRDGDADIYVMNADGTGQTQLTNAPGPDTEPVFSPDGSQIAFRSNRAESGIQQIYTVDVTGANIRQVTDSGGTKILDDWGVLSDAPLDAPPPDPVPPPVEPRSVPFDVDLGPSEEAGVVAAYSRCKQEPDEYGAGGVLLRTTGRGCDLFRLDVLGGGETKLEGASTDQASEFLPSVWRDRVAFARVYEQREGRPASCPISTSVRWAAGSLTASRGAVAVTMACPVPRS